MQADMEREPWHIKGHTLPIFEKKHEYETQLQKIVQDIGVTVHKLDLFDSLTDRALFYELPPV